MIVTLIIFAFLKIIFGFVLNINHSYCFKFLVLNFEPYGLSFSSSGFTGRQSPAGISLGSDISGNSAEIGLKE